MSDRDALLAAVLAAPDDDLPRLVYADALDETGDPADAARAEFVRVQVELAKWEAYPGERYHGFAAPDGKTYYRFTPTADLIDRERQLLDRVLAAEPVALAAGRPDGPARLFYRRGFVHSVECSARAWLTAGPGLVARHPVREVAPTDQPGVVSSSWFGEAGEDGRLYCWTRASGRVWFGLGDWSPPDMSGDLPDELFDRLPDDGSAFFASATAPGFSSRRQTAMYWTVGQAGRQLGLACLAWARRGTPAAPSEDLTCSTTSPA